MIRKLVHQAVAIAAGLILTGAMFWGLGLWRRGQDARWCRHASPGGVVAEGESMGSDLLAQMQSACAVQRERQRIMFGAIWRRDGQETARCGFELARLQLVSDRDGPAFRAVLEHYGLANGAFEVSDRADQDRFVKACLSKKGSDG